MRIPKSLFDSVVRRGVLSILLTLAGAAFPAAGAPAAKPLKVGLYVDRGSQSGGVIQLARLIEYSPQLQLIPLDGRDLRDGKLTGLDLLVVPGGSSSRQYESMQEAGAEAIRRYVADGGAYFGVCAGFHCALNRPQRIGLLPYTIVKGNGTRAVLVIELSEKGAKLLDIEPGQYEVVYSRSPIATRCEQPGTGWGEELAVYRNSISRPSMPDVNFSGRPALLHGRYGKGKVIATSFHPEYRAATRPIACGCIYAVTGVKPAPVFPVKTLRPLRVGYYTALDGKRSIAEALMLDRQPDLDVNFSVSFPEGALEHLDVMIFPEGRGKHGSTALRDPQLLTFLDRGGKVVAVGPVAEAAPRHPNVIRLTDRARLLETLREIGKK